MRCFLLVCSLLLSPVALAGTVLENALWRVEIDPATLAIHVIPSDKTAVQASSGVPAHRVNQLSQSASQASWQWDDGAYRLSATLDQRDLALTITARDVGELAILCQPASTMGKGLIWPLAEGHYVPAGNAVWQDFLLEQGDVNTTQDLSLPLWGVDHGAFTLNWLMTNPYNNRLHWQADGKGLAMSAFHEFTTLDPAAPMTVLLHLGESDPLAGAKRYHQWLVEQGLFEPLEDKLRQTPEAEKLLGASHIYLWGNDLLSLGDVRDWPQLLKLLRSGKGLAAELNGLLDKEAAQVRQVKQPYEQAVLLRGLNAAISTKARQGWQPSTEPNMTQLADGYGALRRELAVAFAGALSTTPETWGNTLSVTNALKDAGLKRLW